ncbi:MAG TPA: hypothetical protein VMF88_14500 [Bacteroidota bacterium]|nr:hypothetical protein [Bacteroidota bacterium]
MNVSQDENIALVLRQARNLLAVAVVMMAALDLIDPPFSSFRIILNFLVLVILVFTLFRIHRFVVALKSSTPTL